METQPVALDALPVQDQVLHEDHWTAQQVPGAFPHRAKNPHVLQKELHEASNESREGQRQPRTIPGCTGVVDIGNPFHAGVMTLLLAPLLRKEKFLSVVPTPQDLVGRMGLYPSEVHTEGLDFSLTRKPLYHWLDERPRNVL